MTSHLLGKTLTGAIVLVLSAGLAACGSSSSSSAPTSSQSSSTASTSTASTSTASTSTGPATTEPSSSTVVAKGSGPRRRALCRVPGERHDPKQLGPGFNTATGYTFSGFSGDSGSLAAEIKGKVRQGDLFVSASPTVNTKLEGAANGNWVSWYATFASSPLVLGYNPSSKFAADLKTKPWYQVLAEPGILVGRTDPVTDPKGALTVKALSGAGGH